jgi:hypothetical protein
MPAAGEQIAQFMSALKAASWTYGLIGVFGLILASVGLAGVTAYSVAQRGHEIGIRTALGAQQCDVLGLGCGRRDASDDRHDHRPGLLARRHPRAVRHILLGGQRASSDPVLLVGARCCSSGWRWHRASVPARRRAR